MEALIRWMTRRLLLAIFGVAMLGACDLLARAVGGAPTATARPGLRPTQIPLSAFITTGPRPTARPTPTRRPTATARPTVVPTAVPSRLDVDLSELDRGWTEDSYDCESDLPCTTWQHTSGVIVMVWEDGFAMGVPLEGDVDTQAEVSFDVALALGAPPDLLSTVTGDMIESGDVEGEGVYQGWAYSWYVKDGLINIIALEADAIGQVIGSAFLGVS